MQIKRLGKKPIAPASMHLSTISLPSPEAKKNAGKGDIAQQGQAIPIGHIFYY